VISVLIVVAAACAFGIAASLTISWASGKSPLWNIGFGVVVVLLGVVLLLIGIVLLMPRFSAVPLLPHITARALSDAK
jgi:hypothetical protein